MTAPFKLTAFLPPMIAALLCVLLQAGPASGQVPLQAAAQKASIGRIDLVEGEAHIVNRRQQIHSRIPQVGDTLNEGDTLSTGKNGEIHLSLDDGSVYALRADTRMNLVQHKASGGDKDGSVVSLLQGAMRTITGWLGRRSPQRVRLQTPTATIGIRGTDHEVVVILPGDGSAPTGTYNKVNAGATVLRNDKGETEIAPGQVAYAQPKAAPRVLPDPPAIFHPTRNEKRLEGLDAALSRSSSQAAPRSETGSAGSGNVRLQGNTRIEAETRNTSASASGRGNTAKNQAGVIGGE
ncbi:FecR family protein [Denitratisoma oestradiolicum]|uniref:FecR protein domain-containing protein n=1 Tax=Denitratisoma oestradiolicum TaxID=311182 RepID=A0A6S6XRI2_9PROT|nr:FecR family protein [Denitratisoma oestradiolicum]TWO81371.1 hypothetical protein CBW56_04465 [Denitratisoma oestradiolicum]CAB1368566.1 exported protein of unknown function [Denitratisoma oestradiolicum]